MNMSSSKVTVQHRLGKEEALRRIKGLLGDAQQHDGGRITDLRETWTDDGGTFAFKLGGFKVSGSIDVREIDVEIDVDYPLAARPFKEMIEATLRDRAQSVLAA
jgi:hypothetical protein